VPGGERLLVDYMHVTFGPEYTNERNELGDRVQHPQARQFARLGFLLRIKSGLSGCTGKRIESRLTTEEGTG
jgi:hypothetical protein